MSLDEFLEGSSLTGRQAVLIFFGFLLLVVLGALILIVFSDFFQGLAGMLPTLTGGTDSSWSQFHRGAL